MAKFVPAKINSLEKIISQKLISAKTDLLKKLFDMSCYYSKLVSYRIDI